MLTNQYFLGSLIVTGCVIFHVFSLLILSKILVKIDLLFTSFTFLKKLVILVFSVLFVITIHMVEIIIWAICYLKLGEFNNISDAIYFSTVTSTTLGYGDIVLSPRANLLSGFEAIGGLILFGVSTALFIRLISLLFENEQQ